MTDINDRDEPLRANIPKVLAVLKISRAQFARMAGVADATVQRYVDGDRYSEATEAKLRIALTRLENGEARAMDAPEKPSNNGGFLLPLRKIPVDLAALRIEAFGDDDVTKLRIAVIHDGAIRDEWVADKQDFDRLMAKLARMRKLLPD